MIPEILIIPYQKIGGSYQLVGTVVVHTEFRPKEDLKTEHMVLKSSGELIMYSGLTWNGGSGPAIDTKSMIALSLPHDCLYRLIRLGLLPQSARDQADEEGVNYGIRAGMCQVRADWVLWAVQTFAQRSALPENKRKTYYIDVKPK